MARESVEDDIIDGLMGSDTGPVEADADDPPYMLYGKASMPVSKKAGKRWKERIDQAITAYDAERQSWDLAFKEYRKTNNLGISANGNDLPTHYHINQTDENLTRENVKTLLRNTYTRNPSVELTSIDTEDEAYIDCLKQAINQLMQRKTHPGLNMKARARRWIVHGHLTNHGVMRLDYQDVAGSRAEGQAKLLDLQKKLSEAKTDEEIQDLYGELEVVEEELPSMRDPGMLLTNVPTGYLVVDPNCKYLDLSDAQWVAENLYLNDNFIKKRYLHKNDEGVWVRITDDKVPGAGFNGRGGADDDVRERITNEILGVTTEALSEARLKGKTKCWLVWDRLTKQVSLWIDGTWDYPLYVWEDTLKLSRFFPYFLLSFAEPLDGVVQEGESAQYYGQVQEINKINQRVAHVRMLAFGTLIYNSRVLKGESVTKLISHFKSPNQFDAMGVDWDPETKLDELFNVFVPPDAKLQDLYNKDGLMRVVDRITSTSEVARGGQFKTNTTNRAVDAYSNIQAGVVGELTDAIEEATEELIQAMMEILVSKYSKEQVELLIGKKNAEAFQPMSVEEFNATFSVTIASGSTEKPTSENKKNEAIQLSQSIGQVGQATPMTTLKIMFRMFDKAFPDFIFTKEDEEMLNMEAEANLTKGQSVPSGEEAPPSAAPPVTGAPGNGR